MPNRCLAEAVKTHNDNADLLVALPTYVQSSNGSTTPGVEPAGFGVKAETSHGLKQSSHLLAETPARRQEALEYIERAIEAAGPQPMLLDTKGTILLYDGKAAEAAPLFEKAVSAAKSAGPDPRYCFHLALAYDRLGEKRKAGAAWKRPAKADWRTIS